jgi:hypothetical protein
VPAVAPEASEHADVVAPATESRPNGADETPGRMRSALDRRAKRTAKVAHVDRGIVFHRLHKFARAFAEIAPVYDFNEQAALPHHGYSYKRRTPARMDMRGGAGDRM